MRFFAPLALLILTVAAADTARDLEQAPVLETDSTTSDVEARNSEGSTFSLQGRSCSYNGCECQSRGKQFHSCGNCVWTSDNSWVITKKRVATHIYECAPDGNCCDYGYATDCGTASARCYISG